jgi:ferredoxin-NADP reductase/ferredoxin
MAYDKPIDFGLQKFCESCNKCARECPSGAITAGPKLMYNGYEIWKSDAEKCARYRLTNQGGGMCGRCMKTCPWNLEGLFADALFRTVAMKAPVMAPVLARLDDALGRGGINPVKKWWWDIEQDKKSGRFVKAAQTHARGINPKLKLRYEDQTLAVYPADVMPSPLPVVQPVDREAGIARYRSLLRPSEYKERLAGGDAASLEIRPKPYTDNPPVFPVLLKERIDQTADVARYDFVPVDGRPLPAFEAGAHIDVVIAPEYQRQFSLAGDPADSSRYVIGVLAERDGRGGSMLMHRAFKPGRRVFISHPRNHFPLHENAQQSLLFAGGIGVTPLITMAHRLHTLGRDFELHYSAASRQSAGFISEIDAAPWRSRVKLHMKDEDKRAELDKLIPPRRTGVHLYTCGSPRYMDAVLAEARRKGWPEDSLHWEYFAVPEPPERENHPFRIRIAGTERIIDVPADMSAADALGEAGIRIDMKCSDGICGVCACELVSGEVDHRDYVLSTSERKHRMITCCSRASQPGAVVTIAPASSVT